MTKMVANLQSKTGNISLRATQLPIPQPIPVLVQTSAPQAKNPIDAPNKVPMAMVDKQAKLNKFMSPFLNIHWLNSVFCKTIAVAFGDFSSDGFI